VTPPARGPVAPVNPRTASTPTGYGVTPGATASPAAAGWIALRYLQTTRVLVQGSATGRRYEFSAASPIQNVDSRDAFALLATGFFRRA
jgi:hypothetical protein